MPIPDNIRVRLEQLRMEAALRAEMERRQQQAQANAEAMARGVQGKAEGGSAQDNLKRFLAESTTPHRMYTGTSKDKDFTKFNVPKNGAWFTPSTDVASAYAKENDSKDLKYDFDTRGYKEVNTADRVMPVYLRTTKPYQITADDIKRMNVGNYKKAQSQFFDSLRALGHDSAVFEDGTTVILEGPHQIKSAIGNRGTYDPTNPDITKAEGGKVQPSVAQMKMALNKQGMYSPLEKAAMAVPRSKGTPAEFMAEISKQPGFRKDEVEDRKISLPEGKMTKEEFLGHLKKHPAPLINEHLLGGNEMQEALDQMAQEIIGDEDATFDDLHGRDRDAALYDVKQNYGYDPETKYEEYALPGGDNYRELLLTLPSSGLSKNEKDQKMWLEATQRRGQLTPEQDVQLMKLQIREQRAQPDYQSNHWEGHPNVLAHMRLSDRFVPNENGPYNVKVMQGRAFSNVKFPSREEAEQFAEVKRQGGYQTEVKPTTNKKILHVDEIQSDWHQQGRKEGYKEQFGPEEERKFKQLYDRHMGGQDLNPDEIKTLQELNERRDKSLHGVPDAPFKKNWHELALKHALGMAAKGGYHGIAITPGQQQADRYDLSKHINKIDVGMDESGEYSVVAEDKNGNEVMNQIVPKEKLADHVGKDMAEKIVSQVKSPEEVPTTFSGLDLKVGGEGMKGFYDKIVPAYLNKLGKPHGAQVSSISVNAPNQEKWGLEDVANFHGMTGSDYLDLDHQSRSQLEKQFLQARNNQTTDLHYFPMTESMRQQIKGEGLPQYDKGGKVDPIEQMRQELAASGNGPIGMDALKQNVKGAWQVLKNVPGNLQRLATDPVAYIRSLPAPTGEQIMNMAGPGNIGFAGMMIGPKARTWHTGRAQMAEAMEMARRTPEEIWQATRTIKGPDGIWRQEISDKGSSFNMIDDLKLKAQEYKDMIEGKKALLAPDKSGQKDFWPKALTEAKRPVREEIAGLKGDLSEMTKNPRTQGVPARWTFEHPELYAAYPELADLPVIQNYKMGPEKGSLYTAGGKLYNMEVNDPRMPRSIALHEMQHAIQNIEGMTPGANPGMALRAPEYAPLLERIRSNPEEFPHLKTIPRDLDRAAYEWYRRQHGEAEARATQARQDMTDAERAQSFPYSSYDVNPKDFLTRDPIPYTGKVSEAHGGSVHPLLPDFEE